MTLVIEPRGTTIIAEVIDRFDVVTAPEVKADLVNVISDGAQTLIIDLSQVSFLDSSGVGALVAIHKAIEQAGGQLHLAAPTRQAHLVLRLTQLESMFSLHRTIDDALADVA
jgi:anti-sigma B factor antagonist